MDSGNGPDCKLIRSCFCRSDTSVSNNSEPILVTGCCSDVSLHGDTTVTFFSSIRSSGLVTIHGCDASYSFSPPRSASPRRLRPPVGSRPPPSSSGATPAQWRPIPQLFGHLHRHHTLHNRPRYWVGHRRDRDHSADDRPCRCLAYGLFSDSGHTLNWGVTPGTNTGNGALQSIAVFGQIPPWRRTQNGSYFS